MVSAIRQNAVSRSFDVEVYDFSGVGEIYPNTGLALFDSGYIP